MDAYSVKTINETNSCAGWTMLLGASWGISPRTPAKQQTLSVYITIQVRKDCTVHTLEAPGLPFSKNMPHTYPGWLEAITNIICIHHSLGGSQGFAF